jgi:hypothetical protein
MQPHQASCVGTQNTLHARRYKAMQYAAAPEACVMLAHVSDARMIASQCPGACRTILVGSIVRPHRCRPPSASKPRKKGVCGQEPAKRHSPLSVCAQPDLVTSSTVFVDTQQPPTDTQQRLRDSHLTQGPSTDIRLAQPSPIQSTGCTS